MVAQDDSKPDNKTENSPEQAFNAAPGLDDELNRDIEQLRTELEQAKDRALRFQAELDNYRKRVNRQMDEERRYACLPVLRDLLPVLDNIGRAIEAGAKTQDAGTLLEGVKLVGKQLEAVLQRHHCLPIEALNQSFDPNFHEAISQQPSGDFPHNTVMLVAQSGYRLHDRVVRPAQVIVSMNPDPAAPSSEGDGTG